MCYHLDWITCNAFDSYWAFLVLSFFLSFFMICFSSWNFVYTDNNCQTSVVSGHLQKYPQWIPHLHMDTDMLPYFSFFHSHIQTHTQTQFPRTSRREWMDEKALIQIESLKTLTNSHLSWGLKSPSNIFQEPSHNK